MRRLFPSLCKKTESNFVRFAAGTGNRMRLGLDTSRRTVVAEVIGNFMASCSGGTVAHVDRCGSLSVGGLVGRGGDVSFTLGRELVCVTFGSMFRNSAGFCGSARAFLGEDGRSRTDNIPCNFISADLSLERGDAVIRKTFLGAPRIRTELGTVNLSIRRGAGFGNVAVGGAIEADRRYGITGICPSNEIRKRSNVLMGSLMGGTGLALRRTESLVNNPVICSGGNGPGLGSSKDCEHDNNFDGAAVGSTRSCVAFRR